MVISKVRRNNKAFTADTVMVSKPQTVRERIIEWINAHDSDFTVGEISVDISNTTRRTIEKMMVELTQVNYIEKSPCRCGCSNVFSKVKT